MALFADSCPPMHAAASVVLRSNETLAAIRAKVRLSGLGQCLDIQAQVI
jgi:hypothetical protein